MRNGLNFTKSNYDEDDNNGNDYNSKQRNNNNVYKTTNYYNSGYHQKEDNRSSSSSRNKQNSHDLISQTGKYNHKGNNHNQYQQPQQQQGKRINDHFLKMSIVQKKFAQEICRSAERMLSIKTQN